MGTIVTSNARNSDEDNYDAYQNDQPSITNRREHCAGTTVSQTPPMSQTTSVPQSKVELSEREKRRIRREALLEEEHDHNITNNNNMNANPSSGTKKRKATLPISKPRNNNKKQKKFKKSEPAEECVKVKMNTGMLYLYRGLNRWAAFL